MAFPDTFASKTVNGQLVPVLQQYAFTPGNAPGPSFRGGARPPQSVPMGVGATLGVGGNGAYGASTQAAAQPGSLRGSPLPLLLVSLVLGLLILRYVHWR